MPSPDRTGDPIDGNDNERIVEETILVDAQGNIIGQYIMNVIHK